MPMLWERLRTRLTQIMSVIVVGAYVRGATVSHNFKKYISNNDATCNKNGTKTATCTRCNATDTLSVQGSALGHSWNKGIVNKKATCTEKGKIIYTCVRCKEVKVEEVSIDANNHTGKTEVRNEKKASCSADGYTGDIYCSACNKKVAMGEIINKLEHSWGSWKFDDTEHWKECTCGEKKEVSAHTYVWVIDEESITSGSQIRYEECSVCKRRKVENVELSEVKNEDVLESENIAIKSISMDAISRQIAAGKKITLTTVIAPSNASNQQLRWSTSDEKYATVNSKGIVSTKKAGKGKIVTITAEALDGSGIKANVKLKLMKNAITKVKMLNVKKTLKVGHSMNLKAIVKANGKNVNKKLKWTSSNSKYATVNSKGKVTAKKAGKGKTVTITAMSTDGTNKKAKVKITIK